MGEHDILVVNLLNLLHTIRVWLLQRVATAFDRP